MSLFKVFVFFFSKFRFVNPKREYKAVILTVRRGSSPLVFVLRETLGLDLLLLA